MERNEIEARFETLETKLAYLEDFIARLQNEVVERNAATDKLLAEHEAVKEKLLQIASELEELPNRKPPHY
ncbi:MAG: SlyX protein [Treponema sp. GWB1_62_6]|nr:MAG: SlyX protein [Treponema sp. GWA1_62_8]OHE66309.1 MAG: SlyX protein [Treponema sp. GWC1_61_84]OHE71027.1 MAG: SlyX protein [Treponema sp. RIFOXYC1_FULL_61_9]OHE71132.1 MAG: SlyX protein [Treponema sp. GWB1_62_6]HCM26146.1 SlyX protein [Treponema sp.]